MHTEVISVTLDTDQEHVARIARKYDLSAVPVVDDDGKLVGRVTIDDIVDVLQEEANEDIQRMAGISDEEVLQENSAFRISRNRLPWLLISFLGELGSAVVLDHFNATLEEIIISAFFIPVIMATGGNAGIQSSTIVVRSLALGEGGVTGVWNRVLRELRVAMLNGFIVGALLFSVISLWKSNMEFGTIAGLAMLVVMINSAVFGALIPFILNKLKIDPAIATGPFITTANDIFGLLIYLSMVTFYLLFWR
jgi:magnesium transporter